MDVDPTTDQKIKEVISIIDHLIDKPEKYLHNKEFAQSLQSIKQKKILDKKQTNSKKKTLNRKQNAELGLYNLSSKSLKYCEMIPLNELWKQYIISHLGIDNPNFKVPRIDEVNYLNFSLQLVKSDFHGADIKVVRSKCPSLVHKEGIVVLDTKNTFVIVEKDDKTRTIPKSDSVFQLKINSIDLTIFGKHFNMRSAERSVKKVKNIMVPDI